VRADVGGRGCYLAEPCRNRGNIIRIIANQYSQLTADIDHAPVRAQQIFTERLRDRCCADRGFRSDLIMPDWARLQKVAMFGDKRLVFGIYRHRLRLKLKEYGMKIDKQMSDEAVLAELGQRFARRRIDLGLTQAQAAEEAGIGKRTIERIEAGGDTQITTLIRLLRVLDLADELNRLAPEPGPRPMDLLKLKGKQRKRASSRHSDRSENDWQWGDKQ